jgi:DNA-directed RNA polymerase specialized sigma24 family protein
MTGTKLVSEIVYREDLYPRIKSDPAMIQRYAENLEVLPPIEINQHNELIDGFHRWTAHRKMEADEIAVTITQTNSDLELLALAIQRNASHGLQLGEQDKRKMAIRLYNAGTGMDKQAIAQTLSVSLRSVQSYLGDVDKQIREERKERIFNMWMAAMTYEEIAEALDLSVQPVKDALSDISETLPKNLKLSSDYMDSDYVPPLYNVWTFAKKTNGVSHFGNSEQAIVDNLLYLYTQPFDIVVDPFAGGGATIDVCRKRLRRYCVSDRKPIVERENEIRKHDLVLDGAPNLNRNWSQVTLTYLDPPYWKQAEGQYSNDPTDLANMELNQFTDTLTGIVRDIAKRQSKGVIALLIQPTQWKTPGREFADHVTDLVRNVGNKKLTLENRVSVPYSTEQYNAQQVNWAKENRKLLVITRELIIWRVGE